MKKKNCCMRWMLPVALFVIFSFSAIGYARTVICESVNNQTRFCPADTRGGVRLIRQLSKSGCYERENWGYDSRGIWVSDGCRAKFEVLSYAPPPHEYRYHHQDQYQYGEPRYDEPYRGDYQRWHQPRNVKCESWDNRQNYCRFPVGNANVSIERQLSDASCRFGKDWGWNPGGIWVRSGCRAIFSVY